MDTRFRNMRFNLICNRIDILHAIVNEINLTAAVEFLYDSSTDNLPVGMASL